MQKNEKVSTFETAQQNGLSYCRYFISRIISVQLAPAVFNPKLQPNSLLEFWYNVEINLEMKRKTLQSSAKLIPPAARRKGSLQDDDQPLAWLAKL